jgi:hypothetical protein
MESLCGPILQKPQPSGQGFARGYVGRGTPNDATGILRISHKI